MNNDSFKKRMKLGSLAEQIVFNRMEKAGRVLYVPAQSDKAHLIDAYVTNPIDKSMIAIEIKRQRPFKWKGVKTYSLPHKNWNEYVAFCNDYSMELILIIVDTETKEILSSRMSTLMKIDYIENENKVFDQYPLWLHQSTMNAWKHNKILLPFDSFEVFGRLTNTEIELLNKTKQQ